MELFLGIGQFAAALAVAFFTWKLARYTQELVSAQEASNRVLEQQAEIQKALARADSEPLVSIYTLGKDDTLIVHNLSKYGVEVVKLLKHHASNHTHPNDSGDGEYNLPNLAEGEQVRIDRLDLESLSAANEGGPVFPIGLAPSQKVSLKLHSDAHGSELHKANYIEVRYRYGTDSRVILSDLWAIETEISTTPKRLKQVWHAKPVEEKS